MKNKIRVILKNLKRYKNSKFTRARFIFSKYYDKLKIDKNSMLFQSYDGSSISGNPYYILLEVCSDPYYKNIKKYVVARSNMIKKIRNFLDNKKLFEVEILEIHSKKYCRILSTAKYLINNSTFSTYFIKKEGQVYINTWHGTPLKNMGKDINSSPIEIGNTQRNFYMCDYLIYPNDYTFEKMKDAYFLNNLYKGKYVIGGYPRNSVFYDMKNAKRIKKELEIEDKRIVAYMPTWHGNLSNKSKKEEYIYTMKILLDIDKRINDDIIIYVKLHNFISSNIDFGLFENIRPFPEEYETYEFLNISDALITDYSSVLFDYANTKRKIILYAYDKESYLKDRGMYIDYEKLPFTIVTNTNSLIDEIKNINVYKKYEVFNKKYTNYDSIKETKKICDLVFKNNNKGLKVINGNNYYNGKKNILIYAGALLNNGLTTSLKGLINNTSREEYNYVLTFYKGVVQKNIQNLEDYKNIEYMPIQGHKNMTIIEALCHLLYYRFNINTKLVNIKLKKMYKRESKRLFYNLKFDNIIHFTGYEKQIIHIFSEMDGKKIIFTHSDMMQEHRTRNNIHLNSLKYAHNKFDIIAVVRESMKEEIKKDFPETKQDKINTVHNLNNIKIIRDKSKQEILFDENTISNIDVEKLKNILDNRKYKKFINIGRYSPEKGQDQLVEAFIDYSKNNKNSYLIIIGSEGPEFNKVKKLSEKSKNVILIKPLSNPYNILEKCDLYILSSHYEGLPMTIMEALILKKPILSTDIKGPKPFLMQGYARFCKDSKEGLVEGMMEFEKDNFKDLKEFNAELFNKQALKEFENILD